MATILDNTSAQQQAAPDQPAVNLPEGVPPLASLYLYLAGTCNLACQHCWIVPPFDPENKRGQYLKFEYVEKAIAQGKTLGLRHIKLTGGEPTLHPQFKEIVALIGHEGLGCNIETNATLIDSPLAEFLREHGVSHISASLDGANRITHENLRSVPGSYQRAIDGIKALVSVGFRPQVIFTIHKGNLAEIDDIVTLAESMGCGSVKFNTLQRVGRGENFTSKHGLSVAEIIEIYRHVEDDLVPRSQINVFFHIPFAFRPLKSFLRSFGVTKCTIHNILGVLATGELSMCGIGTTTPELIYGHLKDNNLAEVWCYNPGLVELRTQVPFHLEGICSVCVHRDFCLGECVAQNYHITQKLNSPFQFCQTADDAGLFPVSRKTY
jgi:SynChlorMet cassette radical SAM/SPASM protein ScmF